jgi:hypothetical protein
MSEKESIDHGYGETVETLFKVFFSEFTLARGDSPVKKAPKSAFATASFTRGMCANWRCRSCPDCFSRQ